MRIILFSCDSPLFLIYEGYLYLFLIALKIKCKYTAELRRFDTNSILFSSKSIVYNLTTGIAFITG